MLNVEKGDKVILKGFTGIKLGVFEVAKTTDKTVTVMKKNGEKMIFSKKTGKQTNVEEGKEKYANSIMEDDGSFVPPQRKKSAKKSKTKDEDEEKSKKSKKSKKVVEPEPEPMEMEDEDEDFEDEFEEEE